MLSCNCGAVLLLSGTLPTSVSTLTSLAALDISNNLLTDSFPTVVSTLTSLTALGLGGNGFTGLNGMFPTGLTVLTQLQALGLGGLGITADLPASISVLSSLTSLDVSGNLFASGQFPTVVLNLPLVELQLSNSNVTTLPSSVSALTGLMYGPLLIQHSFVLLILVQTTVLQTFGSCVDRIPSESSRELMTVCEQEPGDCRQLVLGWIPNGC